MLTPNEAEICLLMAVHHSHSMYSISSTKRCDFMSCVLTSVLCAWRAQCGDCRQGHSPVMSEWGKHESINATQPLEKPPPFTFTGFTAADAVRRAA